MKHTVLKSLAVASVLAMGIAACGSSGSSTSGGSTNKAATGKTLVIESTPLSPMTDTFNPYSQTSTGYIANAISLYNEPLYIFNTLNPAQAPIPFLASGQPTWSNGGMTLTTLDLAHIPRSADLAEKMIRKLRVGLMPPAGMPRPKPAVISSFAASLERAVCLGRGASG